MLRELIRIATAFTLYLALSKFWSVSGLHDAYRRPVMRIATLFLPLVQHFPVLQTLGNLDLRNMDFVVVFTICLFAVSTHVPLRIRTVRYAAALASLFAMDVAAVLLDSQLTAAQDLLKRANLVLYLPLEFKILDRCRYLLYDFGMEASTFTLLVLTAAWNSPSLLKSVVVADDGEPSRRSTLGSSRRVVVGAISVCICLLAALFAWGHVRESNPLHVATHARLGDLFLQAGKPVQAEGQYRAAIAGRTPGDSAWLHLADVLRNRGALEEADRVLQAGLQVVTDPGGRERLREAIGPAAQGQGDSALPRKHGIARDTKGGP